MHMPTSKKVDEVRDVMVLVRFNKKELAALERVRGEHHMTRAGLLRHLLFTEDRNIQRRRSR